MASDGIVGNPTDRIYRGIKESSPLGTVAFIGLRALDPFLQYKLLIPGGWGSSLLVRAGITPIAAGAALATGIEFIDRLGLPLPHLIVAAMSVGSAAKQAYWLVSLSKEKFPVSFAFMVAFFNTLVNTVNTILFLSAATSSVSAAALPGTSIPYPYVLAPVIYALGLILETYSEIQRRNFKDDPRNKDKAIRSGLWRWARHVNYGGYALWRGAYCLASTGIVGGFISGAWLAWDFVNRAVPELDEYCARRYSEQWAAFKREVKWVILPGIY